MKIDKINDNQIRCILNKEDLAIRNIKLTELSYRSEKSQLLFGEILQRAYREFGFEYDGSPLKIEAVPVSAESIILIISKITNPEELDTRFSKFTPNSDYDNYNEYNKNGDFTDYDAYDDDYDYDSRAGLGRQFLPTATEELDDAECISADSAESSDRTDNVPASNIDDNISNAEKSKEISHISDNSNDSGNSDNYEEYEEPVSEFEQHLIDLLDAINDYYFSDDNDDSDVEHTADNKPFIPLSKLLTMNQAKKAANAEIDKKGSPDKQSTGRKSDNSDKQSTGRKSNSNDKKDSPSGSKNTASSSIKSNVKTQSKVNRATRIFSFNSLDDFARITPVVAKIFTDWNSLYKSKDNRYYLVLDRTTVNSTDFNKICNILSEYGTKEDCSSEMLFYFKEHGDCIMDKHALQIAQKYL